MWIIEKIDEMPGEERKWEKEKIYQFKFKGKYVTDTAVFIYLTFILRLYLKKKSTAQRGSLLHKISFDAETGVSDFLNIILVIWKHSQEV